MEIEPLGRLGYGSRGWDLGFEARGGYAEGEEGEISPCVKAKVIGPIFDWSNIFFTASYITLL